MSKYGRKLIICSVCEKEKLNFGFNMCSACLRNYKRKTKPSFYLGTCYSELSRRIKTFDPLRPIYYGLKKCNKKEFIDKFIDDKNFLKHYKNWQTNNFKRKYAPSVDRINNTLGYTLDNLQFIRHGENSVKDVKIKVTVDNKEFNSQKEASQFLRIDPPTLCAYFKKKGDSFNYKGMKITRYV